MLKPGAVTVVKGTRFANLYATGLHLGTCSNRLFRSLWTVTKSRTPGPTKMDCPACGTFQTLIWDCQTLERIRTRGRRQKHFAKSIRPGRPASMRPGRLRHEMWNACGAGEGWHLTGSGTKRVGLCWRPKRSKKCTALNTKSMCPTKWQSGYSLADCRPLSFGCLASDFRVNWLIFGRHCHRKVACRCVAPCLWCRLRREPEPCKTPGSKRTWNQHGISMELDQIWIILNLKSINTAWTQHGADFEQTWAVLCWGCVEHVLSFMLWKEIRFSVPHC